MARRTKQEAQETRSRLLDAAEHLFFKQGVAGTSLAQIASEAGSTRGAIYWHFKDRADLFNAMMDRLTLPFEEELEGMMQDRTPLQALRDHALSTMNRVQTDEGVQRALSIALLMVELVPEHQQIRERHQEAADRHIERIAAALVAHAQHNKAYTSKTMAKSVAIGMHALVFGLMHHWLIAKDFDLRDVCKCSLDTYLNAYCQQISLQK